MRLSRHLSAKAMGFWNQSLHFGATVLLQAGVVTLREDSAGSAEFDNVSAVFHHLPNLVHHSVHSIRRALGRVMKLRRQQTAVAVSAGTAQRRTGNMHTRPDHSTGIKGATEAYICIDSYPSNP